MRVPDYLLVGKSRFNLRAFTSTRTSRRYAIESRTPLVYTEEHPQTKSEHTLFVPFKFFVKGRRMRQAVDVIEIATTGKGLVDITARVVGFVRTTEFAQGLLTIFCRHTSASLLIQENADPDVQEDLKRFFERIAPEDRCYIHASEGPDDMPAHIRAALTQTQLSIPLVEGRMVLGTWQGIYLFEHRHTPHRRSLVLHAIGD